jgi:inhibitor of cysteine peptidase
MLLGRRPRIYRTLIATAAGAAACVLIAGCSLIVATSSSHPRIVTDLDNGKSLTLARGEKLEVALAASSGTGYLWAIKANNPAVLQPRGLPGLELPDAVAQKTIGTQTFEFVGASPGTAKLELQYILPYESETAPARSFEITVTVRQ